MRDCTPPGGWLLVECAASPQGSGDALFPDVQARPLRDPRGAWQGCDGGRLPRPGSADRAARGPQDVPRRLLSPGPGARTVPQPLHARGAERGHPLASEHRHHPRHRRRSGIRGLLHRDGVRAGLEPQAPAPATRAAAVRIRREHRLAGRRRARLRPFAGRDPPRREAGEHPDHRREQGEDHGFRDRAAGQLEPHHGGAAARHPELHVARADPGARGGPPGGHLLARGGALRDADPAQAVPGGEPDGRHPPDRARTVRPAGRDPAAAAAGARGGARAGSREGSGAAVPGRLGARGRSPAPGPGAATGGRGTGGAGRRHRRDPGDPAPRRGDTRTGARHRAGTSQALRPDALPPRPARHGARRAPARGGGGPRPVPLGRPRPGGAGGAVRSRGDGGDERGDETARRRPASAPAGGSDGGPR